MHIENQTFLKVSSKYQAKEIQILAISHPRYTGHQITLWPGRHPVPVLPSAGEQPELILPLCFDPRVALPMC